MKNAFFDKGKTTQLLQSAKYLVGGILKNIRSVTAILKPTINGYKRLVPSHEVPAYIALALSNRSGLIRVQCKRGNSIRVELRSLVPNCNPCLAFTVLLFSVLMVLIIK